MGGLDGLSRREFILLGGGVASYATFAGLGLMQPRRAYAVAGIDDVVLGGLVLLVATLGGYAFSRSVANVSLDALGYGFSDFVRDSNNQAAAVTQAIADANNLGVELNRSNAENAAQSIAAGTGYFAEVMSDAATSGRVALDNFISGAGELPGVLRRLVGDYVSSSLSAYEKTLPNVTTFGAGTTLPFSISLTTKEDIIVRLNISSSDTHIQYSNALLMVRHNYASFSNGTSVGEVYFVSGLNFIYVDSNANQLKIGGVDGYRCGVQKMAGGALGLKGSWSGTGNQTYSVWTENDYYGTGGLVVGGSSLPAVDRAVDAPDVIGPGYDSLPLANDLVIDPSTDEVVSAGSLPLPTSIPEVFGDYVGTLNDILAGVIPGQISLPVSVAEPVVVGTAEGVQSMSITDAIAGDTSLSASISPPIGPYPPYEPSEPPVDVPEGPWTPAVSLPFELIWPFNMIYSFVELFEQLGGS